VGVPRTGSPAKDSPTARGSSRATAGPAAAITVHYRDRRRAVAGAMLAVSAVLLLVAFGGAWWGAGVVATDVSGNSVAQVQSSHFVVYLSGQIDCSVRGWGANNPCSVVASQASGALATLDGVIDAGLLVIAGLGLAGAGLGFVIAFGRATARWQLTLAILLAAAVAAAVLGLCASAVVEGPGAQIDGYCYLWSGNYTHCGAFWGGATVSPYPGGCSVCEDAMTWGAGPSWYLALVAGLLGVPASYLFWVGRRGPLTAAEVEAWARSRGYVKRTPPPAAPASSPAAGPPGLERLPPPAEGTVSAYSATPARRSPWRCPRCQTSNAPWALACGRCGFEIEGEAPRSRDLTR
jgi:hypothetical protein